MKEAHKYNVEQKVPTRSVHIIQFYLYKVQSQAFLICSMEVRRVVTPGSE